MYMTPTEIQKEFGLAPAHVKRDLADVGCKTKPYIFCGRKCTSYFRPDVERIMAERTARREQSKKRYDARPNVLVGTKSQLMKVVPKSLYKKLRNAWFGMMRRCYTDDRKDYRHYREAGITMCDEWLNSFDSFALWAINNGVEEDLSLDRINTEKGYSPDNCRWATKKQQNNNSSTATTVRYQGEEKTITEWAEEYGINRDTLYSRVMVAKWPIEKALTTPVAKRKKTTPLS